MYALKQAPSIDRVNLWAKIRSLNEEQQKIVFHILHLISTRKETDSDEGTKIILQGKAGVGKTYIINVITELVNDYYNRVVGTDFKSNKVLLCAPTGIAAFLINGLTIHSAFSINTKYRKNICKLGDDLIGAIRQEHKDVKVIIADEYSMISRTLRINMDKRCREIYGVNNKSFGGKIVIFAGDLFQLPPVNDRAIYACSDYNNVNDYLYDQVWYDFELFELVEGVRQKHREYQLLLDNFALGQLSKEHADLLKKRIVKSENDVPEDAIWVYYSNKEVNEFNDNRIAKAPGINYESIALDTIHIAQDSKDKDKSSKDSIESNKLAIAKLYAQDISSNTKMRFNLLLKCELRYKLTSNVSVADGLAKSAMATLKRIDFDKQTKKPAIVWLKFNDSNVGNTARQSCLEFMKENKIPLDLVPLRHYSETITDIPNISIKIHHEAIRKQFPITLCEASTFHSTQGLSIPKLCIDSRKRDIKTDLAYVGLSRCDYEGLYLLGKIPEPKSRNQNLLNEVYRLRNASKLKLSYYNFEQDLGVKIVYHNVRSYKSHGVDVTAIDWYWKADIIILSEANVYNSEEVQVRKDFNVVFPLKDKVTLSKQKRSMGLIIICRNSCKIKNLSELNIISDVKNSYHVDLRSFEVDTHFIITGYCSPKVPIEKLKLEFLRLLKSKPKDCKVTLMGDMNHDLKKMQNGNSLYKLLIENDFVNLLNDSITNNAGSQIDIVFSTSRNSYAGTFASYFSDHFAIFFQTCIDPQKLSSKDKEFLMSLSKTSSDLVNEHDFLDLDIKYNVISSDKIKTGLMGNVLFKNEITTSVRVNDKLQSINFFNLSSFNAVLSSFLALYNYTEVVQSLVQGLELNYPFFKFILEIEEKKHNLQYNKSKEWISFLIEHFPNICKEISHKCRNMKHDISDVVKNLLTNWRVLGEKVENQYYSWERKIIKCPTSECHEFSDLKQVIMIELKISKSELISKLESEIESFVLSEHYICKNCNNQVETKTSMISFSSLIILNVLLDNEKVLIKEIPKRFRLNKINFELKIVLCEVKNHPIAYYRINDKDFLEMDDKSNFELVLKDCKEKVEVKVLMYIKCEENLNVSYDEPIKVSFEEKKCKKIKIDPERKVERKFDFKVGILGDVPFPNRFNAIVDRRKIHFSNMCPYNAIFSAFHSLYNHTEIFIEEKQALKDNFPLFKFLLEVNEHFNNRYSDSRNQSWIDFIFKYENEKILSAISDQLKSGKNPIRVNMENDVAPIIERFFDDYQEIFQNPLFSLIVYSVKCSDVNCNGVSDEENRLTLNLFILKTNIKSKIESEIEETIKESNICNTCGVRLNPKFSFSKCVVLNVSILNEKIYDKDTNELIKLQDQQNNTKVNIKDIQKRIVVNDVVYELKVIIDHPPGHFKSYFRIKDNDYLEMDDLIHLGKEIVQKNLDVEINPKVLLYIKSNEKVSDLPVVEEVIVDSKIDSSSKVKYKEEVFMVTGSDDGESVDLDYVENNEEFVKKNALIPNSLTLSGTNCLYSSLCPYNSILDGFVTACNFDSRMFDFVNSNFDKFKFFEVVMVLIRENSQDKRNEIWIEFLRDSLKDESFARGPGDHYPFKKISINSYSMNWDVQSFYDIILGKKDNYLESFNCRLTCQCGYKREKKSSVILVRSEPTTDNFVNHINSLDLVIREKYGKTCKDCKRNLTCDILFSDVLVIFTSFIFSNQKVEIPLSEIPLSIPKNNLSYDFKFLVNFIDNDDPTTNHFDCYAYNDSLQKFFHIDDVGQKEMDISNPSFTKVNPKIIFYLKK